MRVFLKNFTIIILITAGLLLALEGIIRLFWNQGSYIETLSDGRQIIELDSVSFRFRLVPGAKYQRLTPEMSVYYEINEEGLRDSHTYLDKTRDTSKIRILAMGDSFTYGEGSDLKDTWLARLEGILKPEGKEVEIIKAGVRAYDQYHEYYYLKEIIDLYKPDIVMIGFLMNDLFTNQPDILKRMPSNLKREDQRGRKSSFKFLQEYQTLSLARQWALSNDAIYCALYERTSRVDYLKKPNQEVARQYKITADLFRQINTLCTSRQASLIVISIPQFYEVISEGSEEINTHAVDSFFTPFAASEGFTWIPTLWHFKQGYRSGIQTHYRVDGHLTPKGNTLLAYAVKQQLEPRIK